MANDALQFNLSFTADTSKAREEIDKLKNDLNKIISNTSFGRGNNGIVGQAAQLRGILEEATKATGKLDLTKFQRALKDTNLDLNAMAREFKTIDGGAFFNDLANQITNADTRVNVLTGTLKKFAQGLMNTAMWTIQSNAIHAVQGALQSAYGYAQQLNKGLTDIAIVSDLNTQQLTDFAKTANKMAKDLSASTKEVVSGALIYYQAGLSDEEVINRTETTIKLAQTSGESAEQISSYMTSIWNNFYDGSKSVEYYADAISYLGAVTAASNADIAEGLQSFAATAETVGLSFEYAASAMTVIRDITQQSASTVGNSLKTIFARLSSIKSGTNEEDDVDLTKYTKELAKYDVQVLDTNGELRDMDQILDDLAKKWSTLSKTQQTSIAQTVGGVRQYNNLITLMDNYEKFQELVAGTYNSEGYLNKQADIYAESWEAAKNRLTAAWQGIYDQLIDDKFFIKLTNFATWLVNTLSEIIKGMGGIPGVISSIVMAITSLDIDGVARGLRNIKETILLIKDTLTGQQALNNVQAQVKVLEATLGANLNITENNEILQYYDVIKTRIAEITELRAKGDLQSAAVMAAETERMSNFLTELVKLGEQLNILNSQVFNLADAANMGDKDLEDLFTGTDAITKNQLAISNINSRKDASNMLAFFDKINFDKEDILYTRLADLVATEAGKEKWDQALSKFKADCQKDIQDTINEIRGKINTALKDGGNENSFSTLLAQYEKEPQKIIAAVNEEVLSLINTTGKGVTDADKFIKKLLEITEANEKYKEFNNYLKGISGELDKISTKTVKPPVDSAELLASSIRAFSSMTAMSSSIDGLIKNIQKGEINLANLSGTLMSFIFGAKSATTAFKAMGEAIGGTGGLASVFSFLGTHIWAVIGIILALIVAFKALDEILNHDEKTLERWQQRVDESKQAAKEAADEYERVQNILNSLGDKEDRIEELKENTVEWKNAVKELNDELTELITKYHLAYGEDYTIENGRVKLTPKGEEKLQKTTQEEAEQKAQAAEIINIEAAYKKVAQLYKEIENYVPDKSHQVNNAAYSQVNMHDDNDNKYSVTALPSDIAATTISGWQQTYEESQGASSSTGVDLSLSAEDFQQYQDELNELTGEYFNSVTDLFAYIAQALGEEYPDLSGKAIEILTNDILEKLANSEPGEVDKEALDKFATEVLGLQKVGLFGNKYAEKGEGNMLNWQSAEDIAQQYAFWKAMTSPDLSILPEEEKPGAVRSRVEDYDKGSADFSKQEQEDLERYKETIADLNDEWEKLGYTQEEVDRVSQDLAEDIVNFNKGLSDLIKNSKTYVKALRDEEKGSIAYLDALANVRHDLELMLDIPANALSEDFFSNADALNAMEQAANGSFTALQELQELAANDIIEQGLQIDVGAMTADVKAAYEQMIADINNSEQWNSLKIGAYVDGEAFDNSLQTLLDSGALFVDDMNNMLDAIGWEPEVEWEPITHSEYESRDVQGYIDMAGEKVPITGNMKVEDDQQIYIPHIKGRHFKGSPSSRASGANKGGGGGGGGGSKQKTKEKGTNRYHENTEKIGQTKHALEMLNQEEDRAYGQKKLDLIQEKIKLLEQEAKQYKALYDEAAGYNASDRDVLATQYGAKFNKDGTIKNYQEWYDSWVDKYNSGAMDDDAWKKFEDAIKKYEESYKKMNEAEKAYQELLNKEYDARLEIIEHKLSFLNKEIDEANKHIDFLIEQMSKDIYTLADAMVEMSKQAGNLLTKAGNYRDAIIKMFAGENHKKVDEDMIKGFLEGTVSVSKLIKAAGDLTDKEIEMLYEYSDSLEEISKQLIELREKQYETLSKVIDGFNDKIERQSDIVSNAAAILQHYRNVVDIVGKDILGISDEMLKQLGRTSVEAAKKNLAIAKLQLDQNKDILNQMYDELKRLEASGASAEALRLMEEQIAAQEDRVREMSENWAAAWEDALQAAQTAFTDAVKIATDAFDKAVAGSMGNLDNLQDMYDKQNTMNDLYLPKYQQIYELNKLTRDVNNAIDNTDNIAGKERLLELQRDINDAMMEGAQVSEYDVGFMQRRLELEMARIALEEAQNAKNQVRMTRDSEGNWSYTYTADAQKMADAQQNYEDKLYELEKYNQDHIKDVQDMMLNLLAQYRDDIAGLNVTDEERAQMLQDYWEKLQGEYGVFMDKALNDGQFIVNTFGVYDHQLMTDFDDTILSMVSGYKTLEDFWENFLKASQNMMDQTHDAYSDWDGDWHSIFDLAGVDADNFSGEVTDAMAEFGRVMESATKEAQKFADELGEQFDEALKNLRTFVNDYDKQIAKIIGDNQTALESIQAFIYEYDRLHADDDEKEKKPTTPTTPPDQGGGGSGGSGGGGGSPTPTVGPEPTPSPKVVITGSRLDIEDVGNDNYHSEIAYTYFSDGTHTRKQQYITHSYVNGYCSRCHHKQPMKGGGGGGQKREYVFASGGYTGSWGPEGRTAVLHEKELVLNKHDTENMLKTVGFVRDLTQMISLNASVAGQGLGNLFLGGVGQGGGFLDQNVTIHAEFPNATNHTEIEEAFSNLIGLASQYAGRKK